jgi:hypothetical protein
VQTLVRKFNVPRTEGTRMEGTRVKRKRDGDGNSTHTDAGAASGRKIRQNDKDQKAKTKRLDSMQGRPVVSLPCPLSDVKLVAYQGGCAILLHRMLKDMNERRLVRRRRRGEHKDHGRNANKKKKKVMA